MHISETRRLVVDYLTQWADGLITRTEFLDAVAARVAQTRAFDEYTEEDRQAELATLESMDGRGTADAYFGDARVADQIDGYNLDDLGESPDY